MNEAARMRAEVITFELGTFDVHHVALTVHHRGLTEPLTFDFTESPRLTTSQLAFALSPLCGTQYEEIRFRFPVNDAMRQRIEGWTGSRVIAESPAEQEAKGTEDSHRGGVVLNFSGGFDSLAARLLLPSNTTLVSMDFGGKFARERMFYEQFHPLIVQTNIARTALKKNSWSFMGVGALMYQNLTNAQYLSFGGVYESTRFMDVNETWRVPTFQGFRAAGLVNAPATLGLTEVGTVCALIEAHPELVRDSLHSLASPGEEKYYRKISLVEAVTGILGVNIKTPRVKRWNRVHYRFGERLTVDATAAFFLSIGRRDLARRIVKDIPADFERAAAAENMDFFYAAHPGLYQGYPEELRGELEQGLKRNNISWYTEVERESLARFKSLLSPYHRFG